MREIINQATQIVKRYVNKPFRLYLFGSFARGEGKKHSDIDLALETKEPIDRRTLRRIRQSLEEIRTLRKIDFVYLNDASDSIKQTVKKEGILIYEERQTTRA